MNEVKLKGVIRVFKSGRSEATDKAWCRASVKVGKQYFNLKAFGGAAEALGNAHELEATLTGHLEGDKPKDPSEKNWPMVVVVDAVQEHAPGSQPGNAPKAQEDIPF